MQGRARIANVYPLVRSGASPRKIQLTGGDMISWFLELSGGFLSKSANQDVMELGSTSLAPDGG